jgi:hypothetical protein
MMSGGGLMEARDEWGFECAFSGALMIFGWFMSNINIRRYQDSQIKPIFDPFSLDEDMGSK